MIYCHILPCGTDSHAVFAEIDRATDWLIGWSDSLSYVHREPKGMGFVEGNFIIDARADGSMNGFELMSKVNRWSVGSMPLVRPEEGLRVLQIKSADEDSNGIAAAATDSDRTFAHVRFTTKGRGLWYALSQALFARVSADGIWEEMLALPAHDGKTLLTS